MTTIAVPQGPMAWLANRSMARAADRRHVLPVLARVAEVVVIIARSFSAERTEKRRRRRQMSVLYHAMDRALCAPHRVRTPFLTLGSAHCVGRAAFRARVISALSLFCGRQERGQSSAGLAVPDTARPIAPVDVKLVHLLWSASVRARSATADLRLHSGYDTPLRELGQ
jgi:hypothetical protein